ncbi:lipopolysaccharide biosynthesis protein [Sphingomonas sp.]|uniref:lipopolysaccharide biosynthesis protein n=1 Tax=Sphingomonas sp. TaxID=28214 RepID=UPI003AFF8C11
MLLRQTLLYLPAQILAPAVQFASILIWAHLLAPADLGTVTLLVATQDVCYSAFFGWWGLYTLRFIAGYVDPAARLTYLRTETAAVILSAIVEAAVVLPLVRWGFGAVMTPGLLALAVAFLISRSINYYNADRARAEARVTLYSLVQVVGPVIGFLFGLLCIWKFGPTPGAVLAGFLAAQMIGVGMAVVQSDFLHRIGRPSTAILKQAISFGGVQTSSQLLAILAINAPRFIVSHLLGLAAVGMFSVGYSLGIRASSFAVTLVTAGAYPLVVKKMQMEGKEAAFAQLSKNMVLVALVVAPVAFGLLAVNRSVVNILVAERYRDVTLTVLPLATMGGLFRYLRAHTSDQVFLLSLKPQFGTIIAACDIVVAVASTFIGIRLFGVPGAALGPMVSGLATFTLSFLLSRTVFGYRAPFAAFARIVAAAVAMCAAVYALPVARHAPMLVAYVALGGAIYVGLVLLAMPREAKALLSLRSKLGGRFARKAGAGA